METTRNLHHEIIKMDFRIAQDIVHNAAAFDTANDMFHEDSDAGNPVIFGFLLSTEFLISRLFLWLIGTDILRFKALKTCIFKEDTAWRKGLIFFITNAFIMDASTKGVTQIAHQAFF